jgi:maltooligosyltrehalose trehalohydrolase
MHRFSVWAPQPRAVAVKVEEGVYPMQAGERGWWHAEVESAGHGSNYAFLLDDDPHPYPDPRSQWQPNGVHEMSRVLDHSRFPWSDDDWLPPPLADAVIYELHIGTFTPEGTFDAAAKRIEYLRRLGVNYVELMPVASFPGRWGWGYDGAALYAPQERYGGPEGLKRFVDACHAAGLAVLLDVVYNHFGPVGNYTGRYGPYITAKHSTPWGGAVNLEEAGSDAVRRFFCDNAILWLRDYHFDGLRLDAVHAFVDRSAVHFLEQLSTEIDALSLQLGGRAGAGARAATDAAPVADARRVLIAESDLNDPRLVTPRSSGGWGMHAQWNDDFHHALFAVLTGERHGYYSDFGSLAQLAQALTSAYVYDGVYSRWRGRTHGRPAKHLPAHRFLGYIQSHDQVGNRAFGDRLHHIAGTKKAMMAAAIVFTAPFIPMLFQGEEFAASTPFLYFADHEDREMARAVSEGRRREHAPASATGGPSVGPYPPSSLAPDGNWQSIPDPESPETFHKSRLNWAELDDPPHAAFLDWYRRLIALRREHAELRESDLSRTRVRFDESAQWLTIERGAVRILCNFSGHVNQIALPGCATPLLVSAGVQIDSASVTLPAESIAVVRVS